MDNDYNMPDGCHVRDIPGCGRERNEHADYCKRHNRGLRYHSGDDDCICGVDSEDDWAFCEGCTRKFLFEDLAVIQSLDPDLSWCEDCRKVCECGHIMGVHSLHGSGCDGDGELNSCACQHHNPIYDPPAAVVGRAKDIMCGIWMSQQFMDQIAKERL